MEFNKDIIIAGAGIGGLTLALALSKRNISSTLYERQGHFKRVDSGLVLGANAMRVFRELSVAEELEDKGCVLEHAEIRSKKGKKLNQLSLQKVSRILKNPTLAINRTELLRVLLSHIAPNTLIAGEAIDDYCCYSEGAIVQCESRNTVETELLVGADGVCSALRKKVMGDLPLIDAKQVCFRGVCDARAIGLKDKTFSVALGKGTQFVYSPIGGNKVYWFFSLRKGVIPLSTDSNQKRDLMANLDCWFHPIPEVVAATEPENIARIGLYDHPPAKCWYDNRLVLLGDAAHSVASNLGQGAGLAIESAEVLAACLGQEDNLANAIKRYEKLRMSRANRVTKTSWWSGASMRLSNPLLEFASSGLISLMPLQNRFHHARKVLHFDVYAAL